MTWSSGLSLNLRHARDRRVRIDLNDRRTVLVSLHGVSARTGIRYAQRDTGLPDAILADFGQSKDAFLASD